MWIEAFHLKKPVVAVVVCVYKFNASGDGFCLWEIVAAVDIGAVNQILMVQPASHPCKMYQIRARIRSRVQVGPVWVALLAADIFPGGIAGVVIGAAIFPIVGMIADQMRVDAMIFKNFRHGVVVRLYGAPAPVQKIVASCVQLSSGGHTGQASGIALVETHRMPCKPFKVGRQALAVAISRQITPVQRIKHDHDRFHN